MPGHRVRHGPSKSPVLGASDASGRRRNAIAGWPPQGFPGAAPSAFYGSLREPVDLRGVAPLGNDTWSVRYHYATGSKVCDGRAYIVRIRAVNGC